MINGLLAIEAKTFLNTLYLSTRRYIGCEVIYMCAFRDILAALMAMLIAFTSTFVGKPRIHSGVK
jgi:hypothetical protein